MVRLRNYCIINVRFIIFLFFIYRLDFDQSTFSPPENDDSFFYIRYPRATSEPPKKNLIANAENFVQQPSTAPLSTKPDFTKHTAPCQKFIPETSTSKYFILKFF